MDQDALTTEIIHLKDQIHALVIAELDQKPDAGPRYAEARRLKEQAGALKLKLEGLADKQRSFFQALFYQIDADLTFLDYTANKAESQVEESADAFSVIRQFSEEVFALAKSLLEGKISPAEAIAKVRHYDERFLEIARLPGHDTPEMQRLLSDADLELTWIYNGGQGPTSLRLNRLMP